MVSWLFKKSGMQAAQGASPIANAAQAALTDTSSVVRCEFLEGRTLFSAVPDLTNTYLGSVTFKVGHHKVKEAVTLTIVSQGTDGFVAGQVSSTDLGTIDLSGRLAVNNKSVSLVGTSSGGLVTAKIASKGKKLSGTIETGLTGKGKFSAKAKADAPTEMANAASRSPAASGTRAIPLSATPPVGSGALDPTIDPTTGLPIDPATGLPIDPSVTPGEGSTTPTTPSTVPTTPVGAAPGPTGSGSGTVTPAAAAPPQTASPGTAVPTGSNIYSFLGIWKGFFNANGSGGIDDPTSPGATATVNGTRPGPDPRDLTFTTPSQDDTGLVSGTLSIAEFGTFSYTGYVSVPPNQTLNLNGKPAATQIDLVLTGLSTGALNGVVHLNLQPTAFNTVTGTIDAFANGYEATGPITATFDSNVPIPPVALPTGTELFSVSNFDPLGNSTVGNFDPSGASIGEDFSVGSTPLIITSLGTFDSLSDGLGGTIRVAIYNTATPGSPVVVADITNATSSLATNANGTVISAFRYLTTFTPVTLTTGVYRLVAWGYKNNDLAGDVGVGNYTGPVPTYSNGVANEITYPVSNTLNGNSWLSATNGGNIRYPTLEQGLPLNRYLAGSFLYTLGTPVDPNGGGGSPPPPPTTLTKPANSAFPGGVLTNTGGTDVFGSQSGAIIP